MLERREVVGGGLLGLTALFGAGGGVAEAAQRADGPEIARALDELRDLLERRLAAPFVELTEIRQQQRMFLKAGQKFPEFIEIGINVWDRLYDWHVRHQQPLNVVRRDDGRYTMTFMFTTLVLRPEQTDNYVSFAYDAR
jgi:hypothetical protein